MSDRTGSGPAAASAPRDASGDVAREETSRLIAADKVNGTAVYNRAGERQRELAGRASAFA